MATEMKTNGNGTTAKTTKKNKKETKKMQAKTTRYTPEMESRDRRIVAAHKAGKTYSEIAEMKGVDVQPSRIALIIMRMTDRKAYDKMRAEERKAAKAARKAAKKTSKKGNKKQNRQAA